MKQLCIDGFWSWSVFNIERQFDFNGHLWVRPDGNVIIDPVAMSEADRAKVDELGGARLCVVTNADHARATGELQKELGFEIVCHPAEVDAMGLEVDRTVESGEEIVPGLTALHVPYGKTPGEIALYVHDAAAVIFGDIVQGVPVGALRILPDEKLADPPMAALGLRRILPLPIQHILVGDGSSVFGAGRQPLVDCLSRRTDIDIHKVNLESLPWLEGSDDPRYRHDVRDVARSVGAEQLGYSVRRLPPGSVSGPMHYHRDQEELFYIMDGTCTLERPDRNVELTTGDFYACLPGEKGTHKLRNHSDAPCTILCISTVVGHDERELVGLVDFRHDLISP
jgi:uncharacterized cupin superfamily protein